MVCLPVSYNKLMKKYLPFLAIVGILVVLLSGYLVIRSRQKQNNTNTQTPEVEVAQAPINQRPFVSLIPSSDAHRLVLKVINLNNIKTVEYELVYQVNDQQRGVIGSIETGGNSSIEKEMLLGSCSKNVCKYDEGVSEGAITLRLRTPEGVVKYEAPFHLQKMPEAKNKLSLGEEDFVFNGTLKKGVYYLSMNTVGIPKDSPQEIVGSSYGIFPSDGSSLLGKVKIKNTEADTLKLLGWNSKTASWGEIDSSTAPDGLNVFVLVK